jgi:tetratricopeptide (TPR) repeat protein
MALGAILGGSSLVAAATVGAEASAQDCARAYTSAELSRDLGAMTTALRAKNESDYRNVGQRLSTQIACVRKDLPQRVWASAYRHLGAYFYMAGNFEESKRWFKTAIELEPSYEWDIAELTIDHPLRRAFDAQRNAATEPPVALAGKTLAPPSGGKIKLDGRELDEPAATLDRPHILMVVGDDRVARQVFLIEGNEIPAQFLGEGEAVASDEKPEDLYAARTVERVRPPAKTPLMVTGGALALVGGALYGTSFATRSQFYEATTPADLDKYRNLTNTLVIAAGASLAIGVGVEYVGIIISEQPGLAFQGRF